MNVQWLVLLPVVTGLVLSSPRFKGKGGSLKTLCAVIGGLLVVLEVGAIAMQQAFSIEFHTAGPLAALQFMVGMHVGDWLQCRPKSYFINYRYVRERTAGSQSWIGQSLFHYSSRKLGLTVQDPQQLTLV